MARRENRQVLKRIATVLLALAFLAERAGARPKPVLCLVLCLLRPAEALARRFVVETARSAALPLPVFAHAADGPVGERADARGLAVAFRVLAGVLGALAAASAPSSGLQPQRRLQAHDLLAKLPARPAPTAADTS